MLPQGAEQALPEREGEDLAKFRTGQEVPERPPPGGFQRHPPQDGQDGQIEERDEEDPGQNLGLSPRGVPHSTMTFSQAASHLSRLAATLASSRCSRRSTLAATRKTSGKGTAVRTGYMNWLVGTLAWNPGERT